MLSKRQEKDNFLRGMLYAAWALCFIVYHVAMKPVYFLLRMFLVVKPASHVSSDKKRRVAIIGGGVSGLSAAYALKKGGKHEYTIFEAAEYLGGHAMTYEYSGDQGEKLGIDVGFIFGHYFSYAQILEVYKDLGIEIQESCIDLCANVRGSTWATDAPDVGITEEEEAECERFHTLAGEFKDNCALNLVPFGMFDFSDEFLDKFVTPSLCTLFISKTGLYKMSARFMLNMFAGYNKFVDLRSATRTWVVKGGSKNSIDKLADFIGRENIRVSCPVTEIRRTKQGPTIFLKNGQEEAFDEILLACPAPQANKVLKEQSWLEKLIFQLVRYEPVIGILHTDSSVLPQKKSLRRHFNYLVRENEPQSSFELTGRMSAIFNTKDAIERLYTLAPKQKIDESKILLKTKWYHQVQDLQHLITTRALVPMIQANSRPVWYCNSWVTWIGHAGAYDAGMASAVRIGAPFPLVSYEAKRIFGETCLDMFGPMYKHATL